MACSSLKYPVYIISKGRAERPITARAFLKEKIPFKIAIESQELNDYRKTIPEENIAVLPFKNLGIGSTPARNWCWEDSKKNGYRRHFIFDDNIYGFFRLDSGKRVVCPCFEALSACENFVDLYLNIGVAGFNYSMFITRETEKAFYLNCHVYSGLLVNNEIPFRWRLKYNEDVDLCLQTLDSKYWSTIALNIYSIRKVSTTSKMKGGNQSELYLNNANEKKRLKTKSLEVIWPQYVKSSYRFGRPHHIVSWNKFFKHPLLRKVKSL